MKALVSIAMFVLSLLSLLIGGSGFLLSLVGMSLGPGTSVSDVLAWVIGSRIRSAGLIWAGLRIENWQGRS